MSQEQAQTPLPPRNEFIHNAALAGAIVTPLVMLLPPRKADVRLLVLVGAFSVCSNQLIYEYTGQSVYGRMGNRLGSVFDTGLPDGAKRTQQLLKEHKEREAAQRQRQLEEKKPGLIQDIWMGGEEENWKKKRDEEHRKSFQEGKGMSDIIFEQIADVWSGNWRTSSKNKTDNESSPSEDRGDEKE